MSTEPRRVGRAPRKSHVGAGAAESAPTAPHATGRPDGDKRRTGPERFWGWAAGRLWIGILLSLAFHYFVGPWDIVPPDEFEFVDVDGELSIPVDLIAEAAEPPPDNPSSGPPNDPASQASSEEGPGAGRDAGAPKVRDAGPEPMRDAGEEIADLDAGVDESLDASLAELRDASSAPGANGPRDPAGIVGAAGKLQAGPPLVQLLVNMREIRKNPTGAKMGPLLSAIPQWDEFFTGTGIDPVSDTDWVFIFGPALKHTERDVILIHYSAPDKKVDHAIDIIAKKYDRGGVFDAGVPGVHATLGHADFAKRVFLRAQPQVLAVVPPDFAHTAALALKQARIAPRIRPGEALRLTVQNPSHPMPFLPKSITEMRLWIVPTSDNGAMVYAEGDTPDAASAEAASKQVHDLVRRNNTFGVKLATHGVLNRVSVQADGKVIRLRAPVTREQLDAILGLVAGQLGVPMPATP